MSNSFHLKIQFKFSLIQIQFKYENEYIEHVNYTMGMYVGQLPYVDLMSINNDVITAPLLRWQMLVANGQNFSTIRNEQQQKYEKECFNLCKTETLGQKMCHHSTNHKFAICRHYL